MPNARIARSSDMQYGTMMPVRVSGWTVLVCALQLALAPISRAEQPRTGRYATYDFEIPAQPARSAIHEFEDMTGVVVTYWELSADRSDDSSFQVSGNFTAEEALRILLGPSLVDTAEWTGDRSVVVARKILSRADPEPAGRYATYDFEIPGQPLAPALDEFEALTGIGISYLRESLDADQWASAVSGKFTADEALRILLARSGTKYEWIDERTVYAGLMTRQVLDQLRASGARVFDGKERIANARSYTFDIERVPIIDVIEPLSYYLGVRIHTEPSVESALRGSVAPLHCQCLGEDALEQLFEKPSVILEWTSAFDLLIRKRRWTDPPYSSSQAVASTSDVQVEATRLFWFEPEQRPATVVERNEIDRLGVSSLAELLQYIAQQPFYRSEGFRVDGAQFVELRGLGVDTTLVLINGHRVRGTASAYDIAAFDLNTIPITAVERVEIYQDSTPFSVGADAIGGVMNIVLKSHARDPEVDLHYGTADGGARERRVSLTGGLARPSFQATVIVDYFERSNLLGQERDRWRDQNYERFGGADYRSLNASPGNVSSLSADNLPGLPTRFAAVPVSQQGTPTSSDFLSTAGLRNYESLLAYSSILPETERGSAVLTFDWEIAGAHAYGEAVYSTRDYVRNEPPASLSNVVVPANNPHNPFGAPVLVNYLLSEMEFERVGEKDYRHAVLGMRGDVDRWRWDVWVMRTEDRFNFFVRGDLDRQQVLRSLAQSDPEWSFNVFDEGSGGSASLLNSVTAKPVPRYFDAKTMDLTAAVRRDLFTWYGGASSASLGVQRSDFEQSIAGIPMSIDHRSISSAFVSWSVPLMSGSKEREPSLAVTAQGRVDSISDLRSIENTQYSIDYRPHDRIDVKATYGNSYRVPTLFELYQPLLQTPSFIADAARGGAVTSITVLYGGNPDLALATSGSWSIGATFRAPGPNQLRLRGTYWETSIRDRPSAVIPAVVLGREELFADRVARAAPTAEDVAMGYPGRMTSLDVSPGAGGTLNASGVDLQASTRISSRHGVFSPELSATWMRGFHTTNWPGLPAVERVSVASVLGSIPRWNGMAGLVWEFDPLEISSRVRFVSGYADVDYIQNVQTGRDVPSYWLADLQASLVFDQDVGREVLWKGTKLTVGVNNLFDAAPPFAEINAVYGFDTSHGDLRKRFAYLRFAKEF